MFVEVELGKTSLPMRQVIMLADGSIIELKQLTGEPVGMTLAGKLVARGEVVVIGGQFGFRVTEVLAKELQAAIQLAQLHGPG